MSGRRKRTLTPPSAKGKRRSSSSTGDDLKRAGIMRVVDRHPAAVAELQVALLEAIRLHKRATVDTGENAEQLNARFGHLGLRGAAVVGLLAAKVIRSTGRRVKSERQFRHGGENREWEAVDPAKLPGIIAKIKDELKALNADAGKGAK
jgi:hypothetical protein